MTAKTPIAAAVVARMDADTGRVLSLWGANIFYMPHMLTIDHEGNVWVVDCGLHQVGTDAKWRAEGKGEEEGITCSLHWAGRQG